MKTKLVYAITMALGLIVSACTTGMSQSQLISAAVQGAGSAVGAHLLQQNSVGGVVNATYLSNYESLIPKVAGAMNGLLTPADQHTVLAGANGITLSKDQMDAVAFLSGISPEFIAVNGGQTKTVDGAIADAAFQQFAAGMANAVGLVTGTNYVVPALASPTN